MNARVDKVVFRSAYGPKDRVISKCDDELVTKQSFRDLCDINKVLAKFDATGVLPGIRQGSYGDFSSDNSLQGRYDALAAAMNAFDDLPDALRKKFKNPSGLLEFVDANGLDALEELADPVAAKARRDAEEVLKSAADASNAKSAAKPDVKVEPTAPLPT